MLGIVFKVVLGKSCFDGIVYMQCILTTQSRRKLCNHAGVVVWQSYIVLEVRCSTEGILYVDKSYHS